SGPYQGMAPSRGIAAPQFHGIAEHGGLASGAAHSSRADLRSAANQDRSAGLTPNSRIGLQGELVVKRLSQGIQAAVPAAVPIPARQQMDVGVAAALQQGLDQDISRGEQIDVMVARK